MGRQELYHPSGRIERTNRLILTMPRRGFLRVLLLALLSLGVEGAEIALGLATSCALLTDGMVKC